LIFKFWRPFFILVTCYVAPISNAHKGLSYVLNSMTAGSSGPCAHLNTHMRLSYRITPMVLVEFRLPTRRPGNLTHRH
jgi:hypothetical protein